MIQSVDATRLVREAITIRLLGKHLRIVMLQLQNATNQQL